jgi:transposase InsO family protein
MSSLTEAQEKELETLYYSPLYGMSTPLKFWKVVRELKKGKAELHDITRAQVIDYVESLEVRQTRKQAVAPERDLGYFPSSGTSAADANTYSTDLTMYLKLKKANRGYNTILTLIEHTTRYGAARALKGKKSRATTDVVDSSNVELDGEIINTDVDDKNVVSSFNSILNELKEKGKKIEVLWSDQGSEFISEGFKELMEKWKIKHHFANVGQKNFMGLIERFNQTLRNKLDTIMNARSNSVWVDSLQDVVKQYLSEKHSSIGMAPQDMTEKDEIRARLKDGKRAEEINEAIDHRFRVGDAVLLQNKKQTFGKGNKTYGDEIFTITGRSSKSFSLKHADGSEFKRRAQYYELRKVSGALKKAPKTALDTSAPPEAALTLTQSDREAKRERTRAKMGIDAANMREEPRRPVIAPTDEQAARAVARAKTRKRMGADASNIRESTRRGGVLDHSTI